MPWINGNFYANPAYGQHIEAGLEDDENTSEGNAGGNSGGAGNDWADESTADPDPPQARPPAMAPRRPQPARPQPPPPQPPPQERLTEDQRRDAAANSYGELTDGTVEEHEAMISAVLNRANSGDRQYVTPGQAVNFDNVLRATVPGNPRLQQFQAFRGVNYRQHHLGQANNQGARNATGAAALVSRNGPTNNATFYIPTQGDEPDEQTVRALGNVHRVGQVGRVFLYAPGPAPR